MKSALFVSLMLILTIGFIIGAVIGAQVLDLSYIVDKHTIYTFINEKIELLGSISSFLTLIFAISIFIGWRKQQKAILLTKYHQELLENFAKLGLHFTTHFLTNASSKKENTAFLSTLHAQLLKISELITIHYILTQVKREGSTYIDVSLTKQNDFLDSVKDFHLFISNYCSSSNYGSIHFDTENKRIGYLGFDNAMAENMFKDAPNEDGYKYLDLKTYALRVNKNFDLAVDAIKRELE